jgi:hypothetical protein
MIIIKDINLQNFEFWSGAKQLAERLTLGDLQEIEEHLDELYPDGLTETQINDLFCFDGERICELIGENYEDIINRTFI